MEDIDYRQIALYSVRKNLKMNGIGDYAFPKGVFVLDETVMSKNYFVDIEAASKIFKDVASNEEEALLFDDYTGFCRTQRHINQVTQMCDAIEDVLRDKFMDSSIDVKLTTAWSQIQDIRKYVSDKNKEIKENVDDFISCASGYFAEVADIIKYIAHPEDSDMPDTLKHNVAFIEAQNMLINSLYQKANMN